MSSLVCKERRAAPLRSQPREALDLEFSTHMAHQRRVRNQGDLRLLTACRSGSSVTESQTRLLGYTRSSDRGQRAAEMRTICDKMFELPVSGLD